MNDNSYLGIEEPVYLYNAFNLIINENSYLNINLYEKKRIKYYEAIFYNENNEIYIGKFYKDDSIIGAKYKDGKILLYNEQFNHELRKMNITEVLALYDMEDDIFYYCTEEEALRIFDENIDFSDLKSKNKKLLKIKPRKKIISEQTLENNDNKIINLQTHLNQTEENIKNPKILKFPK